MRLALAVLVGLLSACAPTAGQRLADAERLLAAGDAHAAALEFAAVVESTESGTAEWLAAKRGVVRSLAGELPDRAASELRSITAIDPRAYTYDEWIDVIGRIAGADRFDLAHTLLEERRANATDDERPRLDRLDRALRVAAARSRAFGRPHGADRLAAAWRPWDGGAFETAADVASLCADVARSADDAYAGYLALAKRRALDPDDYGALALAFYDELDREHALWVLWTACFEHRSDARLRELTEFVRYGPSRGLDLKRHEFICNY